MALRLLSVLLMLGVIACLLSGCVKMHSHLTVQNNGSADVEHVIAMEPSVLNIIGEDGGKDPLQELRDDMQKAGYTVERYSEGKMVGIKAMQHFKDIPSAVKALEDPAKNVDDESGETALGSIGDIGKAIKVEKSFFKTKYSLNADLDLSSSDDRPADPNDPFSQFGEGLAQSVFDVSFALTLPVKPESSNAPRVSDQGRTLEWPINISGKTNLAADVTVPNVTNMALVIAGGVLLLVLVFILVGLKKSMAANAAALDAD
ncbi:MAG: LppM family (lipo)protein [Armatimonadota bacterium]